MRRSATHIDVPIPALASFFALGRRNARSGGAATAAVVSEASQRARNDVGVLEEDLAAGASSRRQSS